MPSKEYTIVIVKMNAMVREGREGNVIGAHELGTRNNKERMLVKFCTRNNLYIMNA